MKILAVDTSSDICSVAILDNEDLVDEINLDNGKTHSENFLPIIDEILQRNNMGLNNIDLIACVVGPGSFTGIRIGVSTIKAISEVNNIPIVSVTALESLAMSDNSELNKAVLIDAKNNQVYCAVFDSKYKRIMDYIADDINTVIKSCNNYENLIFIGNGAKLHQELIQSEFVNAKFSTIIAQKAYYAGKIGYMKFSNNEVCDADTISPVYLRKSQAERLKNSGK